MIRLYRPEQAVAHQVADARQHAAAVLVVGDRRPPRTSEQRRRRTRRGTSRRRRRARGAFRATRSARRRSPARSRSAAAVAPPKSADAFETAFSSSPRSSGMIERCDAMYGAMKMPSRKTIRTSSGNVRWPVQWRSGTSATSGARTMSETSIVVRAPSRATTRAARDPEQRHRQDLGREDDAHLRRRARRDEHEPRQRHEGHRAAGARDGLGGEQSAGGSGSACLDNIVRPYVFVK